MKLNYKRTVLVGFAFFLICAFWQIYDVTIAMTLTSKFGMSQTASGVVMALDNIIDLPEGTDQEKGKANQNGAFVIELHREASFISILFIIPKIHKMSSV